MTRSIKIFCVTLSFVLAIFAYGCGKTVFSEKEIGAKELTFNMQAPVENRELDDEFKSAYDDFSFEFFKSLDFGKNQLVSPLSAAICLSMIFCGAEGETLSQFENLFGGIDMEKLNGYFNKLITSQDEKVRIADSIWINEVMPEVKEEFLRAVKSYYNSEVYKSPFNSSTLKDLNGWVYNKTRGMIDKILEEMSETAYMYLLNALYFQSEWAVKYEKDDIAPREFNNADGSKKSVEMMFGNERYYFDLQGADCFKKYYEGYKYVFVGILPKEGESLEEFSSKIIGEAFKTAYEGAEIADVKTGIPEFAYSFDVKMNDFLKSKGITRAFSPENAEFFKMCDLGKENVFLDFVLQKTRIEVDRAGTKAAAVTIGGMEATAMPIFDSKEIILDRPFLYAIVDDESGLPLFIGSVSNL